MARNILCLPKLSDVERQHIKKQAQSYLSMHPDATLDDAMIEAANQEIELLKADEASLLDAARKAFETETPAPKKAKPEAKQKSKLVEIFEQFPKSGAIPKGKQALLANNPQAELIRNIQKHWADVLADHGFEEGRDITGRLTNTIGIKC